MKYRVVTKNNGFTLIEVMVAMAVSATLALGSWQLLNTIILNQDNIEVYNNQLLQLDRAFHTMSQDFLLFNAQKAVRSDVYQNEDSMVYEEFDQILKFSRGGTILSPFKIKLLDDNQDTIVPLSQLTRVAYELLPMDDKRCRALTVEVELLGEGKKVSDYNCLIRKTWQYADNEASEANEFALFAGISNLEWVFHYQDGNGAELQTSAEWPVTDTARLLAVEMKIEHFLLGEALQNEDERISKLWLVADNEY